MQHLFTYNPTGAELWQGGERDLHEALARNVKVATFAAWEFKPQNVGSGFTCYFGPFRDAGSMPPAEIEETRAIAKRLAEALVRHLLRGEHVISLCSQGLNRSGLVSALAIMELTGWTGEDTIKLIREKRSMFALNNGLFVDLILGKR